VPGDKSIAHRWLILGVMGRGVSRLAGVPRSLDVRSTAACLAQLAPKARPALDLWARKGSSTVEDGGSTWNVGTTEGPDDVVEVEGEEPRAFVEPAAALECGNSGTTMRLLSGVLAAVPIRAVLVGDASLSSRPMDRVAEPLRRMGAAISTSDGRPPLTIEGGTLHGIRHVVATPSAQVKGAVLLAGSGADGETTVVEPVRTRDHTERLLAALGFPVAIRGNEVTVGAGEHTAFEGRVPGDPSSAAFLVAAAALTGSDLTIEGVGLNPTRLHFLEVLGRMGVRVEVSVDRHEVGEPVGSLRVAAGPPTAPVVVSADELPLVIDEVPILALLATRAGGPSRFEGAGELRVKESDRLAALADGIVGLGGTVDVQGSDLQVGGDGLRGGSADGRGDHRIAMALAVGALGADGPSEIADIGSAAVSFPSFPETLARLGADVEVLP
jgi:3-phosphoshikimate 1-carboxyvinyltransferase